MSLLAYPSLLGAQAQRALIPPSLDEPTAVRIELFNVEIFDIDPQQETFEVQAQIGAQWQDERLAFDPQQTGTDRLIYQGDSALEALKSDVWWPGFAILDARGPRQTMQVELEVDSEGWVYYRELFVGRIKDIFFLHDFPFDWHEISFSVGPSSYDATAVKFVPAEEPHITLDWEPDDFFIDSASTSVFSGWACSGSKDACGLDADCPAEETCEAGVASASVELTISRVPDFYVWKIILPLMLIVLVSSAVFWLDLERFPDPGDRLTIAFTSVLTVVAFDFVSAGNLPKLWYTTTLDQVLITSYVVLALNIVENVAAVALLKRKPRATLWLDRVSRVAFPLAYLLAVAILISPW